MVPLIGFFALLVLSILAVSLLKRPKTATNQTPPPPPVSRGEPCPLCGAPLVRGERVHGVVYKTSSQDKLMDIHGCPYCYAQHPKGLGKKRYERHCPVCRKAVPEGETVTARVFDREGKTHIHVLGCLRCRK